MKKFLLVVSISLCCVMPVKSLSWSSFSVYPNPYVPGNCLIGQDINFTMGASAPITLNIFNALGVRIRSYQFTAPLGPNHVVWDLKNTAGTLQPDDVYYATLTDNQTLASATIFLMKNIGGAGQTLVRNMPALTPRTATVDNVVATWSLACDIIDITVAGTMNLVVKGSEAGTAMVAGGAKGFVNPTKGEKLSIGFNATSAGMVKTKIFDGKGRLVRELNAGTNGIQGGSLEWDARDASGNLVSSGIYLIHVEGPGINITKRTVIIK